MKDVMDYKFSLRHVHIDIDLTDRLDEQFEQCFLYRDRLTQVQRLDVSE